MDNTELVNKLLGLKKFHVNPYNLGDEGELGNLIDTVCDRLVKLNTLQITMVFIGGEAGVTAFFAELPHIITQADNVANAAKGLIELTTSVFQGNREANSGKFGDFEYATKKFNLIITEA